MAVAESCKQQKEPQDEHEVLSEEAGFECIAQVCKNINISFCFRANITPADLCTIPDSNFIFHVP